MTDLGGEREREDDLCLTLPKGLAGVFSCSFCSYSRSPSCALALALALARAPSSFLLLHFSSLLLLLLSSLLSLFLAQPPILLPLLPFTPPQLAAMSILTPVSNNPELRVRSFFLLSPRGPEAASEDDETENFFFFLLTSFPSGKKQNKKDGLSRVLCLPAVAAPQDGRRPVVLWS